MAKKDSREDRDLDYLKGSQESIDAYKKVQETVQKTKDELENLAETQETINSLVEEAKEKEKELIRLKQVSTSIAKINNKFASDEVAFRESTNKSTRKFYEGLKSANAEARTSEAMEARMKMLQEQRNQLSQDASGKHAERNAQQMAAIDLAIRELEIKRDISAIDGRTPEQLQKAADAQRLVVNLAKDQLKTYEKIEETIKSVKDKADSLIESFSEKMSEISKEFKEHVPIIGPLFAGLVDKMSKSIKEKLEGASKRFMKAFTENIMSGKSVMQSLSAAAQGFGTVLTTVMKAAIPLLALSALAIGFERFHKLEEEALSFKKTTGLMGEDVHHLSEQIRDAHMATVGLGASVKDVGDAMATLRNRLAPVEKMSESVVKSMIIMQKNFDVTFENAVSAQETFKNISGLTDEAAQGAVMMASEMAKAAGVNVNQIVGDIAEASKEGSELYSYMKGNSTEITQAAIQARLMGSSLEKMADSAKKMLDFEQGIEDELSAIAISGENMNFGMARELAAAGDLLGMEKEIARQLGGMKDISKMDAFSKEAIAKATGKSVQELAQMQRIEKQFPGVSAERLAAAKSLEAKYGDISKFSEADLDRENERLKAQQNTTGAIDQMKNKMAEIAVQLADKLVPLGKVLLGIFEYGLLPVLNFTSELIKTITGSFESLGNVLTGNFDKVKGIAGWLQVILGTMLVAKGVQLTWNALKAIGYGYTLATTAKENAGLIAKRMGLVTEYAYLGIQKAKLAWEARGLLLAQARNSIEQFGLIKATGMAIMKVISSLASIPFVGWALGIAAAATIAGMASKYMSAGDVSSPADGTTKISTKEGGLYQLSPNDDVVAAPNLIKKIGLMSSIMKASSTLNGMGGNILENTMAGSTNPITSEGIAPSQSLIPEKITVQIDNSSQQMGYEELLAELRQMNKNLSGQKAPVFQADSYRLTAVIANANAANPITTRR